MSSTPSGTSVGGLGYRNVATRLPLSGELGVAGPQRAMLPARAYALATMAHRLLAPQAAVGHRLYWLTEDSFASRDLSAEPTSYLVVGRHTQCDVVLSGDPSIALRHVLVRSLSLDDGCPILSVHDLRTHDGFALSDGSRQRSVLARGPVVLGIGRYSLVALPNGAALPDELPATVADAGGVDPYRGGVGRVQADPVARPVVLTHVTLAPRSVDLFERTGDFAAISGAAGAYELALRSDDDCARVILSQKDIEMGVLIGRAERCVDAGLRAVLNERISRAHVLLLHGRSGCVAYDVASTNGTYLNGRPIRCVALPDAGASLTLATSEDVQLEWRGLP